jgi:hypothetical protein
VLDIIFAKKIFNHANPLIPKIIVQDKYESPSKSDGVVFISIL